MCSTWFKGRAAEALEVSEGQRQVLDNLARSQTLPFRVVQRARALLLAADGVANVEIAELVGVSRPTVLAWRAGFADRGLVEFGEVRAGRGRKPSIPAEKIAQDAFQEKVDADPEQVKEARARRDTFRAALGGGADIAEVWGSGSLRRSTHIGPKIHDLDLVVIFDSNEYPEWDSPGIRPPRRWRC
jgi:hypothetical protein